MFIIQFGLLIELPRVLHHIIHRLSHVEIYPSLAPAIPPDAGVTHSYAPLHDVLRRLDFIMQASVLTPDG